MNNLHNLIENLKAQTELYSQIFSLEEEKLGAITSDNIGLIDAITEQESSLLPKCEELEEGRLEILKNMGFEGKTISELINLLDSDEDSEALKKTSFAFGDVIMKIKNLNSANMELTDIRLYSIDKLIKRVENKNNPVTYQQDGKISKSATNKRVIIDKA